MSLATNIADLATAVATKVKETRTLINGNAADLSGLTTTAKGNLVAAINEVKAASASAAGINDTTTSTSTTWSSSKTSGELAGKATTTHVHVTSDITGLDAALSGKAAASHSHGIADLPVAASGASSATAIVRADDARLANARTPTTHAHLIADLPVAASGVSNTTTLVRADDARLSNARTPTTHAHATSDVTGLDTALSGKAATSHSHAIGDLPIAASGTSSSTALVRADDARLSNARTPSAHVHAISDTTNLQTTLDGKAAASHGHIAANISDFAGAVDARISSVLDIGNAPALLNSIDELAAALGDDANFAATTASALAARVRFDAAQALSGPQKAQALSNIGAAAAADLAALVSAVGDTNTDFAATFSAAVA